MEETNYIDLVGLYLQGNASKQQAEELSRWVSSREENFNTYMTIKNIWEAEHPAFSSEEVERIKDRSRDSILTSRKSIGLKFSYYWRTASAILLFPLVIAVAFLGIRSMKQSRQEIARQSVTSPFGAVSEIMLPDGSEVYLNSGSTLSYPVSFSGNERKVSLSGEAFFEVLSDKEHPFIVSTDGMDIIATGTKFNVEAYSGCTSRVTLVSGVLDINTAMTSYSLPQGYQLQCGRDGSVVSARTDTFKWTAWKDGIIAFRGDRLSYVFERLSLIYNAKILIEDPELADFQIRATFREERLDEIMSLLERCAPIRCVRKRVEFGDGYEMEYHLHLAE